MRESQEISEFMRGLGHTCLPIDGREPTWKEKRNEARRKIKLGVDIIDAINAIYYVSQRPDSFNMIMKERNKTKTI